MPKTLKRPLTPKQEVQSNTTVTAKSNDVEEVLKAGIPSDLHEKQRYENADRVGLNIGVTLNTGSYQSLRIDTWYSTNVNKGETVETAYARVREVIDEILAKTVEDYRPDDD